MFQEEKLVKSKGQKAINFSLVSASEICCPLTFSAFVYQKKNKKKKNSDPFKLNLALLHREIWRTKEGPRTVWRNIPRTGSWEGGRTHRKETISLLGILFWRESGPTLS